jgi:hypothetical protein
MRLRVLSEAECYARCYGGRTEERVSLVTPVPRRRSYSTAAGEGIRERFERLLDEHGPEQEAA